MDCTNSDLCTGCHIQAWLWSWGKSVQKFIFIQTLFLSCFHVLCPSPPQGNQVNGPECWGSGVWAESCSLLSWFVLLNLSCAKWGRCRNYQFWLLLTLWTLIPGIQIHRMLIKGCQSDFSHFDADWWVLPVTQLHLLFCLCAHSQQKENISQYWSGDNLPGIFVCSTLNNHHIL